MDELLQRPHVVSAGSFQYVTLHAPCQQKRPPEVTFNTLILWKGLGPTPLPLCLPLLQEGEGFGFQPQSSFDAAVLSVTSFYGILPMHSQAGQSNSPCLANTNHLCHLSARASSIVPVQAAVLTKQHQSKLPLSCPCASQVQPVGGERTDGGQNGAEGEFSQAGQPQFRPHHVLAHQGTWCLPKGNDREYSL